METWAVTMLAGSGYRVADRAPVVHDDPPLTLDGIIGPRPAWHRDAACREHVDLDWFPHGGRTSHALLDVCAGCLVRVECADAGLGEQFGIWGGLTVLERRRALAGGVAALALLSIARPSRSCASSCATILSVMEKRQ